jgi:hypothetical protein
MQVRSSENGPNNTESGMTRASPSGHGSHAHETLSALLRASKIAWLKQLETRGSIDAKCKFIAARLQDLRQLVW